METATAQATAAPVIPIWGSAPAQDQVDGERGSELIRLRALRPDISSRVSAGPVATANSIATAISTTTATPSSAYSCPKRPR